MLSASKGTDYVIHLAALASMPRSVKNPIASNAVNIDGTLNVPVAARDSKVRRFVYVASSSAYGEALLLPKTESMAPFPISPCGVTKYVGELHANVFGRVYGLGNASVRSFNFFGRAKTPLPSTRMLRACETEGPRGWYSTAASERGSP